MKMFEKPEVQIEKFDVADVITASFGEEENGGGWA